MEDASGWEEATHPLVQTTDERRDVKGSGGQTIRTKWHRRGWVPIAIKFLTITYLAQLLFQSKLTYFDHFRLYLNFSFNFVEFPTFVNVTILHLVCPRSQGPARLAEPHKLTFDGDSAPFATSTSDREGEVKPAAADTKPFTFSPDILQIASEEAAVPGDPTMIATITKAMKNGTVIMGVINIFDTKDPRSNRQFWGAKANVIILSRREWRTTKR